MTVEAGTFLYLAGAITVGFAWGKLSSRLPVPELARLFGTFVCTGLLGALFGLAFGLVRLMERAPGVEEWLSLPFLALVQQAFLYAGGCFLVGAVLGGPSILGFAFGCRKQSPN